MIKIQLEEKVLTIAKNVLENKKISLKSKMEDIPEWDSLKHIQLIIAIEENFKISIDFEDTLDMTSIVNIYDKVKKYLE